MHGASRASCPAPPVQHSTQQTGPRSPYEQNAGFGEHVSTQVRADVNVARAPDDVRLCREQGGTACGQLTLPRPLSAPAHMPQAIQSFASLAGSAPGLCGHMSGSAGFVNKVAQRQGVPQAAPSGRPAPANRARFSTDEVHLVFLELKRLRVIGVHLEDEGAPHLLGRGGLARGRRGRCCGPLHGARARGAVLAEHHVPVCTRVVCGDGVTGHTCRCLG